MEEGISDSDSNTGEMANLADRLPNANSLDEDRDHPDGPNDFPTNCDITNAYLHIDDFLPSDFF